MAICGVMGTTILQAALSNQLGIFGLPVSSFPFSIMGISLILTQGGSNCTIAVPLESITTPEDHLRRTEVLRDGFAHLFDVLHQASIDGDGSKGTCPSEPSKRHLLTKSSSRIEAEKRVYDTFEDSDSEESYRDGSIVDQCIASMFNIIDKTSQGFITIDQFKYYLNMIGFCDRAGQTIAVAGEP